MIIHTNNRYTTQKAMPRKEFIDLVKEIKKTGQSQKMSIRRFLWEFDYCEKRTSGNVWRINEFLDKEKMTVIPNCKSSAKSGQDILKS